MASDNGALSAHYRDRFGATGIFDANIGYSQFTGDLTAYGGGQVTIEDGEVVSYTPPTDSLLFGQGKMGELRADVRATWRSRRSKFTAGTQVTRFVTDHDYDIAEDYKGDETSFFSPLALRRSSWRFGGVFQRGYPVAQRFLDPGGTASRPLCGTGDQRWLHSRN